MRSALGQVSRLRPGDRSRSRCDLRINTDFALLRLCAAAHKRKNWLFAGSALAGQRAAGVMSLVQSAKLNGLDPWAYLRDVLVRIHTHPNHRLDELLPHRWRPA
jgi:hypothetical protein